MNDTNNLDLLQAFYKEKNAVKEAINLRLQRGVAKITAERKYREAKRKLVAKLQHDKVKVTLIRDLVLGDPQISQLREEYKLAEILYDNTIEVINFGKLNCRLLSEEIKREYNDA